MKGLRSIGFLAGALLVLASQAAAQAPRKDVIWARSAVGQVITLDGVLGEPAWAKADSVTMIWHTNTGDPGSGYKVESGINPKDPLFATIKFLVVGNQLYMAATVKDSSVGGSADFNKFDGFLMALKDHRDPNAAINGPIEFLYSWWHPENPALNGADSKPGERGFWMNNFTGGQDTIPLSPADSSAWYAVTHVRGHSNTDATPDTGYVVEMRWDLSKWGYNAAQAGGDVIEFNISVYDCDWLWPILTRFSANRTWWESPWGNVMWYDQVQIHTNPTVTINSGAVPTVDPDVRIPTAGSNPSPTIDGLLNEPVWSSNKKFDIRYGDFDLRATYPGVMKWRSGQFQPDVNGGKAPVVDPGDATIRWFFKGDTLFMGFDVRDQFVQTSPDPDRYDGFKVVIVDTSRAATEDKVEDMRDIGFHIGHGGTVIADGFLPYLRDTLHTARLAVAMKAGTTVADTVDNNVDTGWTAELAVNLRSLGFPTPASNRPLWIGIDLFDGDSFSSFQDSYATRTWWGVERAGQCCPANAYLDPNLQLLTGVDDSPGSPSAIELLGNYPNPFRSSTTLRYALPRAARVTLDVFDLAGRNVEHRALGVQTAGMKSSAFTSSKLRTGVYLYRLTLDDPLTHARAARLSGKMMVVK